MAAHVEYKKDGTVSKMRSHKGNIPILPQTKFCPHCPAKFTRTTHLNRHLRTHTNEKLYRCDTCPAQFTRSDLLTRHKRSCNDIHIANRTRRKSCKGCAESKIKCDLQQPCGRCVTRRKECVYSSTTKAPGTRVKSASRQVASSADVKPLLSLDDASPPPTSAVISVLNLQPIPYHAALPTRLSPPKLEPIDHTSAALLENSVDSDRSSSEPASYSPDPTSSSPSSHYQSPSSLTIGSSDTAHSTPWTHHQSLSPPASIPPAEPTVSLRSRGSASVLGSRLGSEFEPLFSGVLTDALEASSHSSASITSLDGYGLESHQPSSFSTPGPHGFRLPFDLSVPKTYSSVLNSDVLQYGNFLRPELRPIYPTPSPVLRTAAEQNMALSFGGDPPPAELQHYLYFFHAAFSHHLPIVHPASFSTSKGRSPVLQSAMQACGALYVKTKKASQFIQRTLSEAREVLINELSCNPTDPERQASLLVAVVLLQTIGFFHEDTGLRQASNMYHEKIVMMIQRFRLMPLNASWVPLSTSDVDAMWKDWAHHETIKRCLTLSYLLDCCHTIYFALSPSYTVEEVALFCPCEDRLFDAPNATEWLHLLNTPSPYGDFSQRVTGIRFVDVFEPMSRAEPLQNIVTLSPFAHFVLQHTILRQLFTACLNDSLLQSPQKTMEMDMEKEVTRLQHALHNWLKSWLASPDLPKVDAVNEEPPFIQHSLQFYWLGQIALMAYQEWLPPFERGSSNNVKSDFRFQLIGKWLKHIRRFLRRTDQAPTLLWDELVKVRLSTIGDAAEEKEAGILSFWPER